jgi:opacity protein-like surface antigen
MTKKTLILIFLFCNILIINAQKGWELGVVGGTTHYFGDLNTSFDVSHPGYAGSGFARYNFNERLCAKASVTLGSIRGNDAWSKNIFEQRRNLSFTSAIKDFSGQLEFNFLPYIHGSRTEFFTPYLMAGFSVFGYNPTTDLNGKTIELRPLGTEGQLKNAEYGTSSMAFLYGGGFKIDLSDSWSLNLEIAGRKVGTDYLDDVSGLYPSLKDVRRIRTDLATQLVDRSGEPKIGQAGRQRGNARNNDAYVTTTFGIVFYFGGLECPDLRK